VSQVDLTAGRGGVGGAWCQIIRPLGTCT
jgi:hypothetical protein